MSKRFIYYNTPSAAANPYTLDFVAALNAEGVALTTGQIDALSAFELELTTAGLINYSSPASNIIKVLYPYVGGVAAAHKYNFLDPRDLDAAYRITWSGGMTHDANGITGNGVNGIGETYFIPNVLPQDDLHMSAYIRVGANQSTFYDMGAADAARYFTLNAGFSNQYYASLNDNEYNFGLLALGFTGFFMDRRVSSTSVKFDFNGAVAATGVKSSSGQVSTSASVCGLNYLGAHVNYSNRNYALNSFGLSMSDTQATDYYTAIQNFQTALGRQV